VLEIRGLDAAYGDVPVLSGVTLRVGAGEIVALLGPNGAGKSTTISLLVGALVPDSGEVRVGDGDPADAATRLGIGVAPQSLALYDELSGDENLALFGRLYGLSGAKLAERVDWALAFAGLADRRRDRVKTYSGGMKRRLNMACALVHDPPVLLFDEPTVGVDPQSRNHIFEAIEQLKAGGRTILYTTHYMEEAERLCDRVAIVDHGHVIALGSPRELTEALDVSHLPPPEPRKTTATLEDVFVSLTGRTLRDE